MLNLALLCLAWVGRGWRVQPSVTQLHSRPCVQGVDESYNAHSPADLEQPTGRGIARYAIDRLNLFNVLQALYPAVAFSHHSPLTRFAVVNPGVTVPQSIFTDKQNDLVHQYPVASKKDDTIQTTLLRNDTPFALYSSALASSKSANQAEPVMKAAHELSFGSRQKYFDNVALLSILGREAEAEPVKADRFEFILEYIMVHAMLLFGVLCSASTSLRAACAPPPRPRPSEVPSAPHLRRSQVYMSSAAPGHTERIASSTSAASGGPTLRSLQRYLPPLKWLVLMLLVTQNTLTTLLARETRQPRADGGLLYLGSAAVLCSELIKLPVCLLLIARDEGSFGGMLREVRRAIFVRWRDTLRMSVPALCYGLQNALYYVALSHLTATSYQLWSQSKTLFTALFFVKVLGQVLSWPQWFALALLTTGVGIVQLAERTAAAGASHAVAAGGGTIYVGVLAVLASSVLAAFANIYFEKVIKTAQCEYDQTCDLDGADRAPMSLWLRNVQLGLFSIPQAAILIMLSSRSREIVAAHGLFVGFTPAVWMVTLLTASGGLIVGLCVKYADNLLKTYATAVSILVTCAVTSLTTGVMPSARFIQGMMLVLLSLGIYNGVGMLGWWKHPAAEKAAEALPKDVAVEQEK